MGTYSYGVIIMTDEQRSLLQAKTIMPAIKLLAELYRVWIFILLAACVHT